MTQKFKLKKGEIVFYSDKIVIQDDAKKRHEKITYTVFIVMVVGFWMFLNSFGEDGSFLLFYFSVGVISFFILIRLLLMSVKSEISLSEVKSLNVKQGFDGHVLDIKIANNLIRRVAGIINAEDLSKYIETNFENKWNY